MTQTTITLDTEANAFIELFKAKRGFKNKNDTIVEIIKEFQKLKQEELQDKMLAYECSLMTEKALAKAWLCKEDEEAFKHLQ